MRFRKSYRGTSSQHPSKYSVFFFSFLKFAGGGGDRSSQKDGPREHLI
jgi:hypothetical protein